MLYAGLPFPDISPILVEIPLGFATLPIRWYSLAYIVGIFIGYMILRRAIARPALWADDKAPLTRDQLESLLTWMILGIILGGRIGHILFYSQGAYLDDPLGALRIWEGGMAFHGGFLGVVASGLLFCRYHKVNATKLADGLALATPFGLMLGRIANFINAELWGRPTDVPWGVVFPGQAAQSCAEVVGVCARHPSQLYQAGLEGLTLALVLLYLAFRKGWLRAPGAICGTFIAGYGLSRFFVEYFRQADAQFITPENPLGTVFLGMSMGQLLSIPMIVVGLVILTIAHRRA